MSIKREFKVRKVNGEWYVVTDKNGLIPTGCGTKDELLHKFDLSCNYAINTNLVEI